MKLTAALPAAKLGTVLLEQSPVNLECKVTAASFPLGSHDLFLAEVRSRGCGRKVCWTKTANSA